jgi:hypothetical protein
MTYELKDIDRKIIAMWDDSKTGSEIAEALEMSRSAVMGKLYRLRAAKYIEYKTTPVRPKNDTPADRAARPKRAYRTPYFGPIVKLAPQKSTVIGGSGIKLMDLKNNSCRFIVNDGPAQSFLFCGKEKEKGPYCSDHRKLCYVKVTPKQRNNLEGKKSSSLFVLKKLRWDFNS